MDGMQSEWKKVFFKNSLIIVFWEIILDRVCVGYNSAKNKQKEYNKQISRLSYYSSEFAVPSRILRTWGMKHRNKLVGLTSRPLLNITLQ